MEAADVSVVIPTLDRSVLVRRAAQSALDQSTPPGEVIVVDDGSSEDVANAVADLPGVRIVRHDSTQGGGAARNSGIDAATGAIVAFLDSDDVWEPSYLDVQVQVVTDTRVACCRVKTSSGKVIPDTAIVPDEDVATYLFEKNGLLQTSTLILARTLAETVGFDERLTRHQDYDFCLRLEEAGASFVMNAKPLVRWTSEGPARVSKAGDHQPSIAFLEGNKSRLSARQQGGFAAKEIIPRILATGADRRAGFRYTSLARSTGAISSKQALGVRARLLTPVALRRAARSLRA